MILFEWKSAVRQVLWVLAWAALLILPYGIHLELRQASGTWFFVWALSGWVGIGLLTHALFLGRGRRFDAPDRLWSRLHLGVSGLLLGALLCEILIHIIDPYLPRQSRLIMPQAWVGRRVEGSRDYYWQGHLHRFNTQGFRGGEWPPKRPDVFRIIVLGDSLTYGYGIAEEDTYARGIEKKLGGHFRVEVLNLGSNGLESEAIVQLAKLNIPRLNPDLVLYGMCLNDFLPAGRGEYNRESKWPNLPRLVAGYSALGLLLSERYNQWRVKMGYLTTFYTDVLEKGSPWPPRFEKDIRMLNSFLKRRGLPPVLALVLNQTPTRPLALEMTNLAESTMRRAGLRVIPALPYIQNLREQGKILNVSHWEGHPNEEANEIFRDFFLSGIFSYSDLRRSLNAYRKLSRDSQ